MTSDNTVVPPLRSEQVRIAVIGLGYVGLPLAVAFGRKSPVVGFDINRTRVEELRGGHDRTMELAPAELAEAKGLSFTDRVDDIQDCNVYIVTVPTPIDAARQPDFDPLLKASQMLGGILKRGDVVVYESTVYPGVTEEVCVPVLRRHRGSSSTATSSAVTAPSESIRATSTTR